MPKINRIRIANVSYDGKHITDQTFDTAGGENTLLNLANGSGKSVLVQMVLQPTLPCRRVHNRKIESYLSKTSSPTYIMIEWILDNTPRPVYFLTGIAMCSIGQDDESQSRVKYFTFTHKYDKATTYDIAQTPLIEHEQNSYVYMPYDKAFSLLKSVNNELQPLNCYARDKSEAYRKDLERHGIFASEWKLLADINDREGALDEIFTKCKTSDTLLNSWILKTIVGATEQEEQNLPEMFYTLISSILEQEDTIAERELLADFVSDADNLLDALSDLSHSIEKIEHIEKLLAGLYNYLTMHINDIENEHSLCAEDEKKHKAEENHIHYEELSEKWHKANSEYTELEERLNEQNSITENCRIARDTVKREKDVMEAARYHDIISSARKSITALQEQLEILKSGKTDQETQDILFSLGKYYSDMLLQKESELQDTETEIKSIKERQKQYTNEIEQTEKKNQSISGQLGAIEQRLSSFKEDETDCLGRLGVNIHRTLTHELSPDEVETARDLLSERLSNLLKSKDEMNNDLTAYQERKKDIENNRIELSGESRELDQAIFQQNTALNEYKKAQSTLKEIAERRAISESITSIQSNLIILRDNALQRKTEISSMETELMLQRDILNRYLSNSLHTAPAFAQLLKTNGITYITGEDYLKSKSIDEQKDILQNNPMLPFCFLVGKSDFEEVTALYSDGIDRICPVLVLEHAGDKLSINGNSAALSTDSGRAMCYYFYESFAPDKKDSFKNNLEDTIAETENRCEQWKNEVEQLSIDIAFLENFPYDSKSGQVLAEKLEKSETRQKQIDEIIKQEDKESHELDELCGNLRDDIHTCENNCKEADSDITLFNEFLSKDTEYLADKNKHSELKREQKELANIREKLSDDIDKCNSNIIFESEKKSKLQQQIEDLVKKQRDIIVSDTGNMLDWPPEELESRYSDIKSKISNDEKLIGERIMHQKEEIEKAEKLLKEYQHIPESEIKAIIFDEKRLEFLKTEEQRCSVDYEAAEKNQIVIDKKLAVAVEKRDSLSEQLKSHQWEEPLAMNEIKGDYKARLEQTKIKIKELNIKKKNLEDEKKECDKEQSRIFRIIKDPASIDVPVTFDARPDVDIDEQSNKYDEATEKIIKHRDAVKDAERNLKNSYNGKHAGTDNVLVTLVIPDGSICNEDCNFIIERLTEQCVILREALQVLTSHLEHLESKKEDIIFHAFTHGKKLYSEIKRISESSRVKLFPDKPPRQTLKIGVPDELDSYAEERIKNYVNACIDEIRNEQQKSDFTDKMRRSVIEAKMSDREILNQTIGQHTIDIQLLKVDVSSANTKFRKWENVITDNSGGELFLSCFTLLSILIDYSRNSALGKSISGSNTKVMLIDNPFGTTSSNHLLEAMIKVAERFKMQLLCLSDLSQSSITSKFPLIYQLSVRPALYSSKSYLKVDNIVENNTVQRDVRLEHISLRHEQMSVF